jgi:hypothetical protein
MAGVSRHLIFKYLPLSLTLSMNLDFNGTQPVLVYGLHSQLVVMTALILTFPLEKGQRLHASLYVVVRRANPVACASWFRGSRREFIGGNFTPFGGARESDTDSATTEMRLILPT